MELFICLIRIPIKTEHIWNLYGVDWVQVDAPRHFYIHRVNVSKISWQKRNINPQEMFTIGETTEVQILNIDRNSRRISLSIKQLESNPWLEAEGKFPIGV